MSAEFAPCPDPAEWPPKLRSFLKEQLLARFAAPFGPGPAGKAATWRALLRATFAGKSPAGFLPYAASDADLYQAAIAYLETSTKPGATP